MYRFLLDVFHVLTLRFRPLAHYRYPWSETVAVLAACGMVRASTAAWLLGNDRGTVAMAVCATFAGWLTLSFAMRVVLSPSRSEQQDWRGFVLVTEALILPQVLTVYQPQLFALPAQILYCWAMLVQIMGFARISNQSALKVAAGYLLHFVLYAVLCILLTAVFIHLGWIDAHALMQKWQAAQQTLPQ